MSVCGCEIRDEEVSIAEAFLPEKDDVIEKARYYYAGCTRGWTGPYRSSRADANADAASHAYATGHNSGVLSGE